MGSGDLVMNTCKYCGMEIPESEGYLCRNCRDMEYSKYEPEEEFDEEEYDEDYDDEDD